MTRFAAFLRGVNLGKRTVKSAELRAAFIAMGFETAKPLLASGNVVFEAGPEEGLARRIEAGLHQAFGFPIGTVLRSQAELEAMIAANPFASIPETADAKRYVILADAPFASAIVLPAGSPGDFDILQRTAREIFAVAWKTPDGRYGPGLDRIEKSLGKGLVTTRNWNTILKAAA